MNLAASGARVIPLRIEHGNEVIEEGIGFCVLWGREGHLVTGSEA